MLNHANSNTLTVNIETTTSTLQSQTMYQLKYGEFPKLNHLNYSQWHKHMELILHAEDAFEITLGNEETPPENQCIQNADFCHYKGKALALIFESCTITAQ
ncbi:hypothetical protein L873DRAFT_1719870 [Choiromyces venosus 120613-1]|uniref:DUF4219 domain-containing protein n=1 Tax=Choiromyces venosus 120613-1 TaxID=1336337 RepID=A0A3N4IYX1_9PEZI|nr:hypothetical protein L873DRAFT_1719870 [Choiromyces venosus 120613-1]